MTILPLCTFPNIHYVRTLLNATEVHIDLGENYVKQSLRNRFELTGPNGRFASTLHVQGQGGVKTPFKEVLLNDDDWRRVIVRSIESSYGKAAFFDHYIDDLKDLFLGTQKTLVEFNKLGLEWVEQSLGLDFSFTFSENYLDAGIEDSDLREKMKLKDISSESMTYPQVFEDRLGFQGNLSVIDLLMNMGPEAQLYLG
ncbi:MAG: WbqC family protein [Flavobacteriales bacterium]|nr:WbqC family protein [Flavobacteriales bacterium]MDG1780938.1 WbqC family protein [Flavobacteriales bacterium]